MDHIFYLKVENDICSAKVTAISHPYHQVYHVLFEDGYENIFFNDVETGNWIEEDLGETALAANFGVKLYLLNGPASTPCKPLAWCKASVGDEIFCFGFHTSRQAGNNVFEVYGSNHKFLYCFKNKGSRWSVYGPYSFIKPEEHTRQISIIISIFRGLAGTV